MRTACLTRSKMRAGALLTIAVILCGASAATRLSAQPNSAGSGAQKIGVLDMKVVTERSRAIQAMVRTAEAPLKAQTDRIDARRNEFVQKRQQLDSRRSVLTATQIEEEEAALRTMSEEIQDMQHEVTKQYARLEDEVMKPAIEKILGVVDQVATAEGYDLVLPREVVLFHTEAVDLTDRVIARLDAAGGGSD